MGYPIVSKRSRHSALVAVAALALTILCVAALAQATNCTRVPLTVTVH